MRQNDVKLVLENGEVFPGRAFGARREVACELVFDTRMVGYQELLSDPSRAEQMVLMTYPLIGSCGVADEDFESRTRGAAGLVVREYNDTPSNFRCVKTLSEELEDRGVPGIAEVDTRRITRILRAGAVRRAILTDIATPDAEALARLRAWEPDAHAAARASCTKRWYSRTTNPRFSVAALDCGVKLSTIRALNARGCNVTVVPYDTPAAEIAALRADGVFLTDGPGDPAALPETAATVAALLGKRPILGIGLGCQLIAAAYGARTYRLPFGHHGANHPVREEGRSALLTVAQNHGFAVDEASLAGSALRVTHRNVLDGTAEGVGCEADRVFGVQYDPEADDPVFDRFTAMMEEAEKHA